MTWIPIQSTELVSIHNYSSKPQWLCELKTTR